VVLALDLEDGELTAYPRAENSMPMQVHQGRTLWFDLPCLTADAANAFFGEVTPLAQRILDGATIEWDGRNFIGRLNRDARDAADLLYDRCDPETPGWPESWMVSAWDADDWFGGEGTAQTVSRLGITGATTDAEIDAMVEREEADAHYCMADWGCVILRGTRNTLRRLRDDLRED
jgi:hypothetical protein